jgi:hypothetical protein
MPGSTSARQERPHHAVHGNEAAEDDSHPADTPDPGFWHILVRDDFTCQLCGTRRNLQVHHVQRRSQGGTHAAENLLTLCATCHETVHRGEMTLGQTRQAGS